MTARQSRVRVPFLDLRADHAPLRADIDAAIARVIDGAAFIGGAEVSAFETELAAATGARCAIGVSSGTDALLVALMALGVGPGDEVVTTPFTFFATAGCAVRLGARPVFADIDEATWNLDPVAATSAVTAATKVVVPVHLFGRRAELPDVPVPIVEDAAQAIGAGPPVGQCATLSFFPAKNLGAFGDAGAVLTGDVDFAARVGVLRNHGAKPKYFHAVVGGNFRLDAIQAAVLRVKLAHLERWTAARRAAAAHYRSLLAAAAVPAELRTLAHADHHIYNQFVIAAPRRDDLRAHLADAGISTMVYYPRALHLQECFADLGYREGAFPIAERACRESLALPVAPSITADQRELVVAEIESFYRR